MPEPGDIPTGAPEEEVAKATPAADKVGSSPHVDILRGVPPSTAGVDSGNSPIQGSRIGERVNVGRIFLGDEAIADPRNNREADEETTDRPAEVSKDSEEKDDTDDKAKDVKWRDGDPVVDRGGSTESDERSDGKPSEQIADLNDAQDRAIASNRARSRAALERGADKGYMSDIGEAQLRNLKIERGEYRRVMKQSEEDPRLKEQPDYAATKKYADLLEVTVQLAEADRARQTADEERLDVIYPPETTDRESYEYSSYERRHPSDLSEDDEDYEDPVAVRYDRLAERQEKWAGARHRNPDATRDMSVSKLMSMEDRIPELRRAADRREQEVARIKQVRIENPGEFDVQRGLAKLGTIDESARFFGEANQGVLGMRGPVDSAVKDVLRDESKSVNDLNDAFFEAADSVVKSIRDKADIDEKFLDELVNGTPTGPDKAEDVVT